MNGETFKVHIREQRLSTVNDIIGDPMNSLIHIRAQMHYFVGGGG